MIGRTACWLAPVCVGLPLLTAPVARAETAADLLDRLVQAYPQALAGHDGDAIIWRDGTRMPAGKLDPQRSFDDRLRNATILDQLSQPYPRGQPSTPAVNADPGRFRNEALFKKMYGDCSTGGVTRNLVTITWLPKSWGKTVSVTRINGVAERLKRISAEIDELDPKIRRAAFPIAGVLSCRPVADTGRMSMHGYAAAIDLNLDYSDYWLWSAKKSSPIPYKNRFPQQIVDIFERHGFIWGGRWYHYDTMHFEYRPELLPPQAR
ncbi:M15 family metallopeptidase [Bradyrhizobium sp. 83002]|uniref:M15 family metallopeptidase n=1 Tax=Bradyrhizobium aeschynomenes TaxID=2734909 RepID=UPI0015522A67|nr:M15 family metallopeptidase [Bradyrhizobium aeschynomenes]NPU11291.1 M15 family metallopeptidase [Bradyrhizobium aeschynomenes]